MMMEDLHNLPRLVPLVHCIYIALMDMHTKGGHPAFTSSIIVLGGIFR